MTRTPPRPARALALGLGALTLSGCAVIGGDDTAAGLAADNELAGSYGLVAPGTLTVCTDPPYPPFEFEKDGRLTGYDIELAQALADRMELRLSVVDTSFEAIESGASLTGCDVNISGISITPARQQVMAFTLPYLDDDLALVTAKDSGITSVESAQGRRVGVQAGTTGEEFAQEHGLSPVQYEDGGMQVQALQAGTVDALLGNQSVLRHALKDDPRFAVVQEIPTGEQLGMSVAPTKALLGSAVNRAFEDLRKDGTVARLQQTWFGTVQEDYQ